MNSAGSHVITTSPRGAVVNLWQVADGQLLKQYHVKDVAGAGYLPAEDSFVVSNGLGQLFKVDEQLQLLGRAPATHWDNHLLINV